MTTRETTPTEPPAIGDDAPEVEGHRRSLATEQPGAAAEGEPEVEGHRRWGVPSDQTDATDPAEGAATAEAGDEGDEVEGHFLTTNPYLLERAGEERRGRFQAEADRARRADEARKPKR